MLARGYGRKWVGCEWATGGVLVEMGRLWIRVKVMAVIHIPKRGAPFSGLENGQQARSGLNPQLHTCCQPSPGPHLQRTREDPRRDGG